MRIAVERRGIEPGVGERLFNDGRRSAAFNFIPCAISPSSTISATDMRGESEPYGSWKTICISRRSGRIALECRPSIARPQ